MNFAKLVKAVKAKIDVEKIDVLDDSIADVDPKVLESMKKRLEESEAIPKWKQKQKIKNYYIWEQKDEKSGSPIYQVTKDNVAPKSNSGYFDLDALLKLKGLRKMYF